MTPQFLNGERAVPHLRETAKAVFSFPAGGLSALIPPKFPAGRLFSLDKSEFGVIFGFEN